MRPRLLFPILILSGFTAAWASDRAVQCPHSSGSFERAGGRRIFRLDLISGVVDEVPFGCPIDRLISKWGQPRRHDPSPEDPDSHEVDLTWAGLGLSIATHSDVLGGFDVVTDWDWPDDFKLDIAPGLSVGDSSTLVIDRLRSLPITLKAPEISLGRLLIFRHESFCLALGFDETDRFDGSLYMASNVFLEWYPWIDRRIEEACLGHSPKRLFREH